MRYIEANAGSFRDPCSRIYEIKSKSNKTEYSRILRGINEKALQSYQRLAKQSFFQAFVEAGQVINTSHVDKNDADAKSILADGWAGVLEHETVPFVSYPYEWTFSMLKDAALLQLRLLEKSLEHGWIMKDATPYNIQWIGSRPVFIDVPSFELWVEGESWVGYRQFCSMFLTPLMMRAHLGIDHIPILRSYIDGVPPTEAVKFFTGTKRFRKGVLSHIFFPAMVENSIAKRERDDAPAQQRNARRQSKVMLLGLIQSLTRLVLKLSIGIEHTDWSQYDQTHSYREDDFEAKKAFVQKHAAASTRHPIWDIGCNTGTYSTISAEYCKQVIAVDGDHNSV